MKSIYVFIIGMAIQSQASAQTTSPHILEKAIVALSRTYTELSESQSKASAEDTKKTIKDLQKKVSSLTKESLLINIGKSNEQLFKLGFDVTIAGDQPLTYRYNVAESPYFAGMKKEAFELNVTRWKQLAEVLQLDAQNVNSIEELLQRSEIQQTMENGDKAHAAFIGGSARIDALEIIRAKVNGTLNCVAYMPDALKNTGLNIVTSSDGSLAWSEQDLQKKYGESSMSDLNSKQKAEVVDKLNKYMSMYWKYGRYCIDIKIGAFIEQERNRIRDGK